MEDFNQETDKEQDFEQEQNKTEFDVNKFKMTPKWPPIKKIAYLWL